MNTDNVDQFRVTSIPFNSRSLVIFSGVPLAKNSYKVSNCKYYVTIKATPESLPVLPSVGQHWSVRGIKVIEDKELDHYVMQQHTYSNPSFVECSLPDTGEQLIRFIAAEKDFKGIGDSKAREVYQILGSDFHSLLSSNKAEAKELLKRVLTEHSINALFEGYAKYSNLHYCNWMSQHKIPGQIQQRLIKFHKTKSIESIKINPYLLIGFGMSFKATDTLAREKFEMDIHNPNRLSAALEFAIKTEVEKGHTYTGEAVIRKKLHKLLGNRKLVDLAFKAGYDKAQYILNAETGSYHPTAQLIMESVVVKRLLTLANKTDLYKDAAHIAYSSAINDLPYDLTDMQIKAVKMVLNNSISCITGGAGTGKTTVLRTALRAINRLGFQIHAVALAGRAAMRLHESIGFETMTIAALLRGSAIEPTLNSLEHLLVIDEASMLDLPTMYRLINHIHPNVRIVFTGDPDQLPPIGCGKVLADIVESRVIANTMLNIVKRQAGTTGIPEYSKQINIGEIPINKSTGNIYFHETSNENIAAVCAQLYQKEPDSSRILGATKAMVANINKLTQTICNPNGNRLEFSMNGDDFFLDNLKLGDTVLFTRNICDKCVQNGTLGKLVSIEATEESFGQVELDSGDTIELSHALLDCVELGYCITLHKAQGSQFPRIIISLQKGRIVDRAWLYTAITRAENEVHIVGSQDVFESIVVGRSHSHNRNSYLGKLLINNFGRHKITSATEEAQMQVPSCQMM
ncbi:AAA family ATPase [Paraglaciecola mesophila]|uniref:AAA family ATPase n=1 Tax=Paraglaciecola mesophila TaxID=197222 RepID=A0ABU9SW69_9ALTE